MNFKTLLLPLMLLAPLAAQADVMVVNNMPAVVKAAHTPKMGMTQKAVLKAHGQPVRKYVAPGKVTKKNPRITVWTYHGYKVFFENNRVIHTVIRKG